MRDVCGTLYRMGKKTSVYLTDDLAALVEASGEQLSLLVRRGVSVRPLLTEDRGGGFVTHWYCEVPPEGVSYKVLRDYWHMDGPPAREVYEVDYGCS